MSNEQSIRDELVQILDDDPLFGRIGYNHAESLADRFLGSPVVRRIQAEAWTEGAEHAWGKTGEGWNGEYADGHGTHDGTVSFVDANGDHNPYREEKS